ncbi:MAG: transposase [Candidatus Schekmanbacteria bacterium]|nr:MAG: transposase [Candidatus Schekmanbacteria bacterium]
MSRPLRISYPGAWYHVMNRGRRKEKIFLSQSDYEAFIKILQETSVMWNLKISSYCLMPNHYHLLVHTPDGNISRCMRHINGVYTQHFNRYHKKDGQLFRGRYKAVLVEADSHLLEVLRYIHRNPIRAGLVKEIGEYTWDSHRGYVANDKRWDWLYTDILLSMFASKKNMAQEAYLEFVLKEESDEIKRFYSKKNMPSVLGGENFKEWVKLKFRHLLSNVEIPEARVLAINPETIISQVCEHFNIDRETLMSSRRGKENLPKDIAVYLVRLHSKETLLDIGRYFDMNNYSSVSSMVERVKRRRMKDNSLRKHLEEIEKKLNKSQKQT